MNELAKRRSTHPLTRKRSIQLQVAGLSPDRYFFPDEIVSVFDISIKEFQGSSRFCDAVVGLPRPVAAFLVKWLDARFDQWDWSEYSYSRSDSRTGQFGERILSLLCVGKFAGASKASVPKALWFKEGLRGLLARLWQSGALAESPDLNAGEMLSLRTEWQSVRGAMLGRTGGSGCSAIDAFALIRVLSDRYTTLLERHRKELLNVADEEKGGWKGAAAGSPMARLGTPDVRRLSQHLIVVWEYQFSGFRNLGILPRPLTGVDLYNYLRDKSEKATVFERLGIVDDNGVPYSSSPHQIRHWVTTSIIRSGPTEMMVDLWMGRQKGQSRLYDHRTATERAEAVRARYVAEVVPDDFLGRKVIAWRENGYNQSEIDQLISAKLRVLHFVPWGGCSRELFISPCERGLMCVRGFGTSAGCASFHIDPLDMAAKAEIEKLHAKYRGLLASVDLAATDVRKQILTELNEDEPLDQHIRFILDVVRGCETALNAFARPRTAVDELKRGLVPVVVIGGAGE